MNGGMMVEAKPMMRAAQYHAEFGNGFGGPAGGGPLGPPSSGLAGLAQQPPMMVPGEGEDEDQWEEEEQDDVGRQAPWNLPEEGDHTLRGHPPLGGRRISEGGGLEAGGGASVYEEYSQTLPRVLRGVSAEMILRGKATSLKRNKTEDPRKFLARVTHLQLENTGLTVLAEVKAPRPNHQVSTPSPEDDHADGPGEEGGPLLLNSLVPNLRTCYAYENKIERVGNLGEKVEQLYLQSNELVETGSWSRQFPKLKVLRLDRNRLRVLEGLDRSQGLEELSVAHQRLPAGVPCFAFDPLCLRNLARSLTRLDVSGNHLWDLSPLACLQALVSLTAADNRIGGIEGLEVMLQHCRNLRTLDVRGNPFASKDNPKYRDEIIVKVADGPLSELDGKDVTDKEKLFIRQLAQRRNSRRASKDRPLA